MNRSKISQATREKLEKWAVERMTKFRCPGESGESLYLKGNVDISYAIECPQCGNSESFYCVTIYWRDKDVIIPYKHYLFLHRCEKCNWEKEDYQIGLDVTSLYTRMPPKCDFCDKQRRRKGFYRIIPRLEIGYKYQIVEREDSISQKGMEEIIFDLALAASRKYFLIPWAGYLAKPHLEKIPEIEERIQSVSEKCFPVIKKTIRRIHQEFSRRGLYSDKLLPKRGFNTEGQIYQGLYETFIEELASEHIYDNDSVCWVWLECNGLNCRV